MAKPKQQVLLDLNNPVFQKQLFALNRDEVVLVFTAFEKLTKLDWPTLQKHTGFKWEDAGHKTPALARLLPPPLDEGPQVRRLDADRGVE